MLKFFFIFLLFFLLFTLYFHPLTALNQDLARHLTLGKIIVTTVHIPHENLFSYTNPHFVFINSHWFSEVVFYLLSLVVGVFGIGYVGVLLGVTAFAVVFIYSIKQKTNLFALSIVTFLSIFILLERTDPRPELFSFLFTTFFITILYYFKKHHTRLIYLLIPVQLLWTNMHIYFPIGIGILGIFVLDALWTNKKQIFEKKNLPKPVIELLIVLFIASATLFINPFGIKGALYPLFIFNNYGVVLEENQNIFLAQMRFMLPAIWFFEISAVLLFVVLYLNKKKTSLADWLLAISFTLIATTAVRNMPLFVYAVFIPFALYLSQSTQSMLQKKNTLVLYCIGIVTTLSCIYFVIASQGFGITESTFPKQGVDFFIKNNLTGPIFNNFDTGSYLIYRLFPREKVFVDERPEAYPTSFFTKVYGPMLANYATFKQQEAKYKFNSVFYEYGISPYYNPNLFTSLLADSSWRLVYLDGYTIIFVKDIPSNKAIIEKFAIKSDAFNPIKITNIKALYNLLLLFQRLQWNKSEIAALKQVLSLNPKDCTALQSLANAFYATNDTSMQLYAQQYSTLCK